MSKICTFMGIIICCAVIINGCLQQLTIGTAPNAAVSAEATEHFAEIPDIGCPLKKQGINPDHMRPFQDTEKYIQFLERSDRAAWQKPDEVIAALRLTGLETIADIGAGPGYFTFRFAKAVPAGTVFAIDIDPEMLRHVHHRALSEGFSNITVLKAGPDDLNMPAGVDLAFVCDVLHHVENRRAWLASLAGGLRSGARLAVVEFKTGDLPEGPPESIKISKKQLVELITQSGFRAVADRSDILPYQSFLIFEKM